MIIVATLALAFCAKSDSTTAPSQDAGTVSDAGTQSDAGPQQSDGGASTIMSFFVTSVGNGWDGGSYGGLTGADSRCQTLIGAAPVAASVKARTWRAYLSTQSPLVNARDRIGAGPWHNFNGQQIALNVSVLHDAGPPSALMLTELGTTVPSTEHDILTGSNPDGTLMLGYTCGDWTSNDPSALVQVGHWDWDDTGDPNNWNSAHGTQCDRAGGAATSSAHRLYCFASN